MNNTLELDVWRCSTHVSVQHASVSDTHKTHVESLTQVFLKKIFCLCFDTLWSVYDNHMIRVRKTKPNVLKKIVFFSSAHIIHSLDTTKILLHGLRFVKTMFDQWEIKDIKFAYDIFIFLNSRWINKDQILLYL